MTFAVLDISLEFISVHILFYYVGVVWLSHKAMMPQKYISQTHAHTY